MIPQEGLWFGCVGERHGGCILVDSKEQTRGDRFEMISARATLVWFWSAEFGRLVGTFIVDRGAFYSFSSVASSMQSPISVILAEEHITESIRISEILGYFFPAMKRGWTNLRTAFRPTTWLAVWEWRLHRIKGNSRNWGLLCYIFVFFEVKGEEWEESLLSDIMLIGHPPLFRDETWPQTRKD